MIANAKTTTGKVTAVNPAVGYCRMSTDRQDKSIGEQRTEIEKLAARDGFTIIRWYEDHGISGDKTEKRVQFKRMIADAARGEFTTILVWDQDRFGRFDSIEAGHWIHPLRQAGVELVTVTEGPIDWDGFTGRIMYGIKQEGKHQFLVDLSRNTARGQIKMAESGTRNSRPPYAYDRMLVDENGEHRSRVKAGEVVPKPRGWRSIIVPGDKARVDAVKWIFKAYATTCKSLRELANELNERGVPSATGIAWNGGMVRGILRNAVYQGDSVFGQRSTGRYHEIIGSEIHRVKGQSAKVRKHPKESWIVKADNHEALVDRKTWAKAQKKLVENRALTGPRSGEVYLLTGLCHCGHCGSKMHGWSKTRKHAKAKYVYRTYLCAAYIKAGTLSGCGHHQIHENVMVDLLLRKLREAVFAGAGSRESLEQRVRERLAAREKPDPAEAEQFRKRLTDLDRQIGQAADRLLKAPSDLTDILAPRLTAMRTEREQLAAALSTTPKKGIATDVEKKVKAVVGKLSALSTELEKAKPEQLKELLRRMVVKVDLWFEKVTTGRRTASRCTRGIVELRPDPIWVTFGGQDSTSSA